MEKLPYLIKLISENSDEIAFNQLMRFYYPGLLSFANSILKDFQLSEEIIQDIFIKLWENRRTLPAVNNLSNYLYISVKYASYAQLKKRKLINYEDFGESMPVSLSGGVDSKIISDENLIEISNAINELPPRCRLIFKLIKDEGLKYVEVAGVLNISVKTVEAQMTIALKHLANRLQHLLHKYKNHSFKKNTGSA